MVVVLKPIEFTVMNPFPSKLLSEFEQNALNTFDVKVSLMCEKAKSQLCLMRFGRCPRFFMWNRSQKKIYKNKFPQLNNSLRKPVVEEVKNIMDDPGNLNQIGENEYNPKMERIGSWSKSK